MGLKDRAKKLVSDNLRPWLVCDVFPIINVSTSGISLQLPHLEFDVEALNRACMESSPLVIKEAVKVENVQLNFTPFRQPVLAMLVQGWHVVLEPRSAGDPYWEKKMEKTAEQNQIAALFALDPQGASVHAAAEGLAEVTAGNSMITQFLTSLMLTSVRLQFHDCSVRLVSHIQNERQHFCNIPLSSFEVGEDSDSWSGGLMSAVKTALRGVWKKTSAPMSKHCSAKGLGLQVETRIIEGDDDVSRSKEIHVERPAAEIDEIAQQYLSGHSSSEHGGMTMHATPEVSLKKVDSHVVLLEDLVLGFRFVELAMDALEFDAPEAAFSLDFKEMHSLQILTAQIQGPAQDSPINADTRHTEVERPVEAGDAIPSKRSPNDLWKKGIQKALELSSHRRLMDALEAGIMRRRYSGLYESWLLEVGWGQSRDDWAERNRSKRHLDHVKKLSKDVSETQKNLPLEAIALGRRVARRRVSATIHSSEDIVTDTNSVNQIRHSGKLYSSFQVFLGSFWRVVVLAMIFIQGKATGVSMWMSAARRLGVREWKSIRGVFGGTWTDEAGGDESAGVCDDSQPVSGLESSSATPNMIASTQNKSESVTSENYFQLGCEQENDESTTVSPEKKRGWEMIYTLKIRKGSITLASGAIGAVHKGKETDFQSKKGGFEVEGALIPAFHLSLSRMVLAYGSTANASGASISCGSLKVELLSIIPSELPKELTAKLDAEVFQREFSSLGRWVAKVGETASLVTSCPCPQPKDTGLQTISELPLAGGMYKKHWIWQDQLSKAWRRTWPNSRDAQSMSSPQSTTSGLDLKENTNHDDRPFLIAEFNGLDEEPSKDDCPGGLIKSSLAMGQLKFALKGSVLTRICLLRDQLMVNETPSQSTHTDTDINLQSQSQASVSFEKFCIDNYSLYLDICREALLAAIPEKSILFSAVIDGPQIRLCATATELYEYQQVTKKDTSKRKPNLDPNMGASVVFDFGRLELAMWPPQMKKEESEEVPLQETGTESKASNEWWNRAVESKLWLKRPPVPALPQDFAQGRYWEHEQVGNNLYISVEEVALILELQKESLKELPVIGPLALVIETSLCWDRYSSLLSTSKSVSAAVSGKISSLSVQSYIHEVTIILQVIGFYMDALKSRSDPDPTMVVSGGSSSLTLDIIAQEEVARLSEASKHLESKPDSSLSSSKEVPITMCALIFSLELEKLKLVLGDSRQEDGYPSSSKSAAGVQAQMKQDVGLRYEPREERLQFLNDEYEDDDDDAYNWEQNVIRADMGREAYILVEDVLLHTSVGDEEQFCMFMGLKDFLLRLVDSSSVSSISELAEIRNHFFSASVSDRRFPSHLSGYESFSGLVLTEVSLEYFSLKVFGPSPYPGRVDESDSPNDNRVYGSDYSQNAVDPIPEDSGIGDGLNQTDRPHLRSHLSAVNLEDAMQNSDVQSTSKSSIVRTLSLDQLSTENQGSGQEQELSVPSKKEISSSAMGETNWLAIGVEVGKLLVTDGGLDALVAKVVLVANGAENLHLDFGLDRDFQKVSLEMQGGLVLAHTAAVATLVQFWGDIGQLSAKPANIAKPASTAKPASLSSIFEGSPETTGEPEDGGSEESRKKPSLSSASRSASVPAPSTKKRVKKFKRTSSAPPRAQIPPAKNSGVLSSPKFEGVVFSRVAGFSLVLARHSLVDSVPAEGVLFELEVATMLEVGDNARKASFDLLRFTVLGLQARVPGNSRSAPGRAGFRTPQFGSSSKMASGTSAQQISGPPKEPPAPGSSSSEQTSGSPEEASEADVGGLLRPKDQLNRTTSSNFSPDMLSSSKVEEIATGDSESKRTVTPQRQASFIQQAEGFHTALSEFNSFILERLSVHCAIDKVSNEDKVWKWTDAWQGQCSIAGFNVAITTSEIQLLEALVAPLSSGGSSKSTEVEAAANALVEGTKEDTDEADFEIPEGAVVAIKDFREHCYLAAEEMPNNKGHYRLVGVLHYTLAGDKALFKVKYLDPSNKNGNTAWLSLLSLHAKNSDGESFRVHYRPGSGLADISSTKDGSWEQWRFAPAETSRDENTEEVDIRNPTSKHLFHLVNQKSKHGIAFEENSPVMVKQPGNPFKVKVIAKPPAPNTQSHEDLTQTEEMPLPLPPLDDQEAVGLVTSIPHVLCTFDTFTFTILHEAAGGLHLLPLLRAQIPGTEGVIQVGLSKTRTILQCSVVLEYYETQSSLWVSIINPIETDVFYRARSTKLGVTSTDLRKTPVTFFSRFKKVEFVVSEPSLDACLFLIGALDLAGPYTVRYSPVRANRCLVENQTGIDALCCFDQGSSKMDGKIPSWHSDSFLMRHMTSRRDVGPAKVASTLELYLQKSGKGTTSPVFVTLGDPGVIAVKTRLHTDEGRKTTGPMVVVDVSRRGQDGVVVTVSPMVRIRNASGLSLELRCRRNSQGEESAVVVLDDGDTIDDSMGAFDALNLEGDMKKALASLNLGNYRLSIRPTGVSRTEDFAEQDKHDVNARHEWSDDVKGAKPVRSAGLFDKLQYSFNKTVKAHNLDTTFGVVFCPTKPNASKKSGASNQDEGFYFLIRSTCRRVPQSRPKPATEKDQQQGRYSVVSWQQQQELLLLPTVRVLNRMSSDISVLLASTPEGRKRKGVSQGEDLPYNAAIKSFGMESLYMDLGDLFLTVKHEDLDIVSKPINLGIGSRDYSQSKGGNLRDIELEVDFGDGIHNALVTVSRGQDGVLEVVILTRYSLQNDSHVTLLCCSSKQNTSRWGGLRSAKNQESEWPTSGIVMTIAPKSRISWFDRSTKILVKRTEAEAQPALLDLESVSGSMEISLIVKGHDSVDDRIQLGVQLNVPTAGDSNPSCTIILVPRYIVANDSGEAIIVCQDGFEDTGAMVTLGPGEHSALHAQCLPDQKNRKVLESGEVGSDVLLTVRFRPKEPGWNWSGPVCVAAIGSFSVKIRRPRQEESKDSLSPLQRTQKEGLWFAVADVQENASSLIMTFRRQPADAIPYRIENALRSASISYSQQGLDNSEILESGASVGYVWDDLGESHTLTINLAGSALCSDINPDKLRAWKSFRAARRKTGGLLQIPFLNDLSSMAMYGDGNDDDDLPAKESSLPPVGYEVYADGPTRVVRICEERDSRVDRHWQSDVSSLKMEIEVRIPLFTLSIVEPGKQPAETEQMEDSEAVTYVPVACLRLTNVLVEAMITPEYTLCQVKAERLDVDVKWQGAPVAAMLRGHGQDRFAKGHTVLHMAVVISNRAVNPIQLKYASILLQAMDLNLDEDTLMKLAPFYRYSLSESTAPSLQIYFERFEIHPIKIVGSFLPGKPRADYSSGQETLRALLHSVIKIPTVRGTVVELNGVLLSNALLTFKQLALKCAQHYSWYSMRAIYMARGSKLLPPGFASLFDDSAASSLDVFFDPSNGSIDLQGLTIGMFGMLSRGLRKGKGKGGTQRYLGDLQHSVKAAGSNLIFAVVTEVSDSVLKGADASGLDGLLGGFRRGILNVAMKPSVLRGAVVQGGSTRRIKLDRIVGSDEAYIEGYLQAMLDALFKQNYLRVKVIDDQVILKNLPPNTTLMDEVIGCVRNFLIGEGLLAGESSAAALSSLRRLRGEDERRLGPTVIALCEQLLVIIVVRSLRRQTIKVLHQNNITIIGDDPTEKPEPIKSGEEDHPKEQPQQGFFQGINFKRAITGFALSSVLAYADGRICRHIPNPLVRRIISGFLLSFVE